jgi:hypothetical protein
MNTILSILVVLVTGLFAYVTFILAENKEEVWEEIQEKLNHKKR